MRFRHTNVCRRSLDRSIAAAVLPALLLLAGVSPAPAGTPMELQARTAIMLTPTFYANPVEWSLREDGRVYFEAFRQSTNGNGLYITGGFGGFTKIFETGDPAPDLPGLTLLGPAGEWVAVNDVYAFGAFLEGDGVDQSNDIALYAGTLASGPQLVFREGDPVPDLPGSFFDFGATNLRVDRQGRVFFSVGLDPGGGALIYGSAGDLTVVATTYDPVPQRPTEVFTGWLSLALNQGGTVAFVGITDTSGRGVWSGPPDAIALRLSVGDPAVGTVGDTVSQIDSVSLTSPGRLAISGALTTAGTNALWTNLLGTPRLAYESFHVIYRPTVSTFGRLAFKVEPFGNPALFAEQTPTAGLVTMLAEWEGQAPGLPAGVIFRDFLGDPVINGVEQVAFPATLDETGLPFQKSLWIHDPKLGTQMVAREGHPIRIAPADVRTIDTLVDNLSNFNGVSLQDGVQRGFNLRGELAFKAVFTDSAAAILVAQRESPDIVLLDGFESGDTSAWQ